MGWCTERCFCYLCTLWLYRWVGFFAALDFFCICFFNGRNDFKIYYNECCPSKGRRVVGWFIHTHSALTKIHNKIRHNSTKVSLQPAKNYKWIMVYFLASYLYLTTWLIIISLKIFISINICCLGLLLLFFILVGFFVWF